MRVSRRAVVASIGVAAAVATAALTRVLQVAIFTVAAGIRELFARQHSPAGPFVLAASRPSTAVEPSAIQNGRGLITYNPRYDRYEPARVTRALREAVAAGATYLRADIPWRDVMPVVGDIDASALEWYATFFRAARETYGFTPLAILSNPAPSVSSVPLARRLELWAQYVAAVVKSLGESCRHFQLMNEPNNLVFRFFPKSATAGALRTAASVIRGSVPNARLSVNFLTDLWPWRDQLEELLSTVPEAIDIVGVDAYPETWSIGIHPFEKLSALLQTLPTSLPGLRAAQTVAVMETGYSSNLAVIRTETAQAEYYRRLGELVGELKKFEFVGIYELTDENSDARLDPEAHFGLLDLRLRRKPAFAEVTRFFAALNS